jgi:MFS family permease
MFNIGVFIASADEFLVLSTYTTIASQFHRLSEGSWLLVVYNFGYCIALPMVSGPDRYLQPLDGADFEQCGALSDIYGRKNVLITSYIFFLLGCLAS